MCQAISPADTQWKLPSRFGEVQSSEEGRKMEESRDVQGGPGTQGEELGPVRRMPVWGRDLRGGDSILKGKKKN